MDDAELSDAAALAAAACARYGFDEAARLTPYSVTENPTFRVEEPQVRAPVALRVYRPGGRSEVEIRSELAWIAAVRAQGVPTPAVVPTLDGDVLVRLPGDVPVFACAFEVAPGSEAGEADLAGILARVGDLTARLHRHARTWEPPAWFARPRWDVETTIGARPHWGHWSASVPDREEQRQLSRLAEVVLRRLVRFGDGPARFGLIHADLRAANLLVDEDRVSLIDFEDCGFSWYMYDLAATLTLYEGRTDVDELIAAWVDAYRAIESLSSPDEAEIKTFLLLRRLMVSAYIGLRPDTELARELRRAGFSGETCRLAESYLTAFG